MPKITNAGFHGKPLIFFYFCDLVFMDYCLNFGWYSRKWWQKKLKLWWYSWKAKKKIETTWCPGWALFGLGGDFVAAAVVVGARSQKKIWVVYHEIRHWRYFGAIWVFICYWIHLRYNVNLTTIIFFCKVQSIKSDGSIVNSAEQIKYSDSQG